MGPLEPSRRALLQIHISNRDEALALEKFFTQASEEMRTVLKEFDKADPKAPF